MACSDDCQPVIVGDDPVGDGYCDDGGPGSEYSICDLGSDCTDCGTRFVQRPAPPDLPYTAPSPSSPPMPPLVPRPASATVVSDGTEERPYCGIYTGSREECVWDSAMRALCARQLCLSYGYAQGAYVAASNNMCTDGFGLRVDHYYAYLVDWQTVWRVDPDYYSGLIDYPEDDYIYNKAIITANCSAASPPLVPPPPPLSPPAGDAAWVILPILLPILVVGLLCVVAIVFALTRKRRTGGEGQLQTAQSLQHVDSTIDRRSWMLAMARATRQSSARHSGATAKNRGSERRSSARADRCSAAVELTEAPTKGLVPIRIGNEELRELDLDKIQLEDVIGTGTSGVVWRAKYAGTPVAVKVLHLGSLAASEAAQHLQRETELCLKLRHPHVLQTVWYAASAASARRGMVSELMEMNLQQYLHAERPNATWEVGLLHIASDVAMGMAYLHDRGVLHRDLKPANILISEELHGGRDYSGRKTPVVAKVSDMGESVFQEFDEANTLSLRGTPAYIAPEVLRQERYGKKADVYSYGAALCHMATRQPPYSVQRKFGGLDLMSRIARGQVSPWGEVDASLWTPAVSRLAAACCAADPDDRPSFEKILADQMLSVLSESLALPPRMCMAPSAVSIESLGDGSPNSPSPMSRSPRSKFSARQRSVTELSSPSRPVVPAAASPLSSSAPAAAPAAAAPAAATPVQRYSAAGGATSPRI